MATQRGAPQLPIVVPAQSTIERGERAEPPCAASLRSAVGQVLTDLVP